MAVFYLETSALVKLYVKERGTERLLQLMAGSEKNQFVLLSLAAVELRSALRRRERAGEISSSVVQQQLAAFQRHLEARFLKETVTDALLDSACQLIDRHGLRAFDSVQLAGCIELAVKTGYHAPTFVCADRILMQAALAEGCQVFDVSQ